MSTDAPGGQTPKKKVLGQPLRFELGFLRKRWVRITVGDRVKMEMSPYDLSKGRITWRLG